MRLSLLVALLAVACVLLATCATPARGEDGASAVCRRPCACSECSAATLWCAWYYGIFRWRDIESTVASPVLTHLLEFVVWRASLCALPAAGLSVYVLFRRALADAAVVLHPEKAIDAVESKINSMRVVQLKAFLKHRGVSCPECNTRSEWRTSLSFLLFASFCCCTRSSLVLRRAKVPRVEAPSRNQGGRASSARGIVTRTTNPNSPNPWLDPIIYNKR